MSIGTKLPARIPINGLDFGKEIPNHIMYHSEDDVKKRRRKKKKHDKLVTTCTTGSVGLHVIQRSEGAYSLMSSR